MKTVKNKKNIFTFVVLMITLVGIIGFVMHSEENTVSVENSEGEGYGSHTDILNETASKDIKIPVYIVGAVKNPGVYYVPSDSIINDVVNMAGGLSEDADASAVNLAGRLTEGMQITVYTKSQVEEGAASGNKGLVNINTADKERLMTLPGIGEAKAEAIIKYRSENGAFKEISEIMNIPGIKEALFSKIKEYITA